MPGTHGKGMVVMMFWNGGGWPFWEIDGHGQTRHEAGSRS
jgi:hypothetical protein